MGFRKERWVLPGEKSGQASVGVRIRAGGWVIHPWRRLPALVLALMFIVFRFQALAIGQAGVTDHDVSFQTEENGTRHQQIPMLRMTEALWTGIALSNPTDQPVHVSMTAYGLDGQPLDLPANPAALTLAPGEQRARLAREYFGAPTGDMRGWVDIESDSDELLSFFQFGNGDAGRLDGGMAATHGSWLGNIPAVYDGSPTPFGADARTTISVVNTRNEYASLDLRIWGTGGLIDLFRVMKPRESIQGTIQEIFGREQTDGFFDISRAGGIADAFVTYAVVETPDSIFGVSVPPYNTHIQELYSPQLVMGGDYRTVVRLLDKGSVGYNHVTLHAVGEDGTELAPARTIAMGANTLRQLDMAELFGFQDEEDYVIGSLRLETDRPGLVGTVMFGTTQASAALPLAMGGAREIHFSQVANGAGAYTGLGVQNISDEKAHVTVEVYGVDGEQTAVEHRDMDAGTRFARLLPEIAPSTTGQVGGRIVLRSDRPIVAQELFGDSGRNSLSAVPGVYREEPEQPLSLDGPVIAVADGGEPEDPYERVHILHQTADGTLERTWSSKRLRLTEEVHQTGGVSIADFDGDGRLEVVHIGRHLQVDLFHSGSTGEPFFSQQLPGYTPSFRNYFVGDANNDGHPEIAIAMENQAALYTWRETGFEEIWRSPTLGSWIDHINIADADGDGLNELLLTCARYGLVVYDYQNGDWHATRAESLAGKSDFPPTDARITLDLAVVGDVNPLDGDGPEILVSGSIQRIVIYKAVGDDYLVQQITGRNVTYIWSIAIADLDGDNRPEILGGAGQGFIVFSKDSGIWQTRTTFYPSFSPDIDGACAHDFDRDGRDELLLTGSSWGAGVNGVGIYRVGQGRLLEITRSFWGYSHSHLKPE